MRTTLKRILWCLLAVAVIAGIVFESLPAPKAASRIDALPLQAFGLAGRDLPLSDAEAAFFRQVRIVKRLYQAGSTRFILLAVDGAGDRHALHDPQYCFRGAGWTVTRSTEIPLPGGRGRVLTLAKDRQSAEALYWFSNGRVRHVSPLQLWWESVLRRVRLRPEAGNPVLVILQPTAGGTIDWRALTARCPQLFLL